MHREFHNSQGKRDEPVDDDNYMFYMNEIPSRPSGMKIDDFHREMWGNYDELEWNHSFIQWYDIYVIVITLCIVCLH